MGIYVAGLVCKIYLFLYVLSAQKQERARGTESPKLFAILGAVIRVVLRHMVLLVSIYV